MIIFSQQEKPESIGGKNQIWAIIMIRVILTEILENRNIWEKLTKN